MSIELQLHVVVLKGNIETRRAHPAISHCSQLLLKCRMATNISQWLKVQSRWFKNYLFVKKCILISFWIFQYCFYYLLCHILLFGCLNFSIPSALMGGKQFRSWSGPTLCWVWSWSNLFVTGPRSAVGNVSGYRCMSDCRSRGREFDPGPVPYFRGDWSWNNFYGHSPPFRWFIQEGLLSVTSESMCTNYWLTACSSLPRKKCG